MYRMFAVLQMKQEMKGWEPLRDSSQGVKAFMVWKDLLEDPNRRYSQSQNNMDPYDRLIWDVWMPHIRTSITYVTCSIPNNIREVSSDPCPASQSQNFRMLFSRTKWSARDCESLIEILEVWLPVLPTWIMGNVLEQLVLPKLQQEVEDWNPLTDTMPIHGWLHPWLPLMGNSIILLFVDHPNRTEILNSIDRINPMSRLLTTTKTLPGERLEPVYAPIRHKLANALKNWHPSDPSAKMILQPWQKVFKAGHLEAFVSKNILPKVGLALSEFVINPSHQQLGTYSLTCRYRLVSAVSRLDSDEPHTANSYHVCRCLELDHGLAWYGTEGRNRRSAREAFLSPVAPSAHFVDLQCAQLRRNHQVVHRMEVSVSGSLDK